MGICPLLSFLLKQGIHGMKDWGGGGREQGSAQSPSLLKHNATISGNGVGLSVIVRSLE